MSHPEFFLDGSCYFKRFCCAQKSLSRACNGMQCTETTFISTAQYHGALHPRTACGAGFITTYSRGSTKIWGALHLNHKIRDDSCMEGVLLGCSLLLMTTNMAIKVLYKI